MNHKELDVWKQSIKLVIKIYKATETFPVSKEYGLKSQLRKSAVSVPSNLAEGSARGTDKELIHFLNISLGSLSEIETQLIISKELGLFQTIERQLTEIKSLNKLYQGLINYLKSKNI